MELNASIENFKCIFTDFRTYKIIRNYYIYFQSNKINSYILHWGAYLHYTKFVSNHDLFGT